MAFSYSVNLTDFAGIDDTTEALLVTDLSAALSDWSSYVTGLGTLVVQLNILDTDVGRANGAPTAVLSDGTTPGGATLVAPSSLYELATGEHYGDTTTDITINVDPVYIATLFLNPVPGGGATVPDDKIDAVSVFRHELAHGFGMAGYYQQDGILSFGGEFVSSYDQWVQVLPNGTAQFVGPSAEAAFGGPVPLTTTNSTQNIYHLANDEGDPLGQDLMNGIVFHYGAEYQISNIDLAILDDMLANLTGAENVTVSLLCFLHGTRIATPTGEVPVQHLSIGDAVMTLRNGARRIVWIGEGRVLATRGRRSAATPVIVRKGALGDNAPRRDLRVTKGHALCIDDVLIPAEFLINHRSILWDDHAQEASLYHVELETHDVLLADGAPAESYRDDGNRWLFRNINSGWGHLPQPPCAPVLTGGPMVDAIWRRLLDRAGPRPGFAQTEDSDLHLLVDGERLDAVSRDGAAFAFRLRARPGDVRIVSRAGAPAELGLARDPRVLGVAIRRIALFRGTRLRIVESDDAMLVDGFHGFEPDEGLRWTNGDAGLPVELLREMDGPGELVLHLAGTARYPWFGEAEAA
ncbi:MAG: Hint domain-containing protein [Acetobacteraceae bacterium]